MSLLKMILQKTQVANSYKACFSDPDGQVVLKHLMEVAFVTRPAFSENEKIMAYREGQRDLVLAIMSFVYKDPAKLTDEIERAIAERGE